MIDDDASWDRFCYWLNHCVACGQRPGTQRCCTMRPHNVVDQNNLRRFTMSDDSLTKTLSEDTDTDTDTTPFVDREIGTCFYVLHGEHGWLYVRKVESPKL